MKLPCRPYWDKIVEYYVDHIHFDVMPKMTLQQWMKKTYNADITDRRWISFERESGMTMFLLRWS